MRYFWDFIDFIIMRELNTPDTICRNYAIEHDYAGSRIIPTLDSVYVGLGLGLLGFKPSVEGHLAVSELLAAMRGINLNLSEVTVLAHVAHFYVYHSLKTGDRRSWKLRTHSSLRN